MLARMAGGTTPEHVAGCYAGLIDALVVDESDPAGALAVRPIVTRTLMTDLDASRRLAETVLGGRRMKVAVVGGTGSFGRAVAKRLVDAGVEVVIGSRDAERARRRRAARRRGSGTTTTRFAAPTSSSSRSRRTPRSNRPRELRQSIGSTPVFSVCAELAFGPGGVKPTAEATSIAQRIQDELDAPVVAGLHSLAASNLADAPPDEDAFVCGDDAVAKRARARARRRGSSPAGPSTAARSRAPARSRG